MIPRLAQDRSSAPYIPDANPGLLQPYRKYLPIYKKTAWESLAAV